VGSRLRQASVLAAQSNFGRATAACCLPRLSPRHRFLTQVVCEEPVSCLRGFPFMSRPVEAYQLAPFSQTLIGVVRAFWLTTSPHRSSCQDLHMSWVIVSGRGHLARKSAWADPPYLASRTFHRAVDLLAGSTWRRDVLTSALKSAAVFVPSVPVNAVMPPAAYCGRGCAGESRLTRASSSAIRPSMAGSGASGVTWGGCPTRGGVRVGCSGVGPSGGSAGRSRGGVGPGRSWPLSVEQ
jgi:hypothetical protein